MRVHVEIGQTLDTKSFADKLISLQYTRNDNVLDRGNFRIVGDVIEVFPPYMETDEAYRIELDWDEVVRIRRFHVLNRDTTGEIDETVFYPAKHFVQRLFGRHQRPKQGTIFQSSDSWSISDGAIGQESEL